jgi:Spy/CpxP family protein refolding chaperone
MKLTKRTIIYMTGIALLTTGIVACNRGTPEERGERIVQKVTQELELTATQQASLEQVKNEFLEMRNTMSSSREQIQADIRAMLKQPRLDRNQANSMVNQRIEAIHTRSPVIIDAIGNFYDSLDDAQRAELREFIEDRMEHHHGRHFWN